LIRVPKFSRQAGAVVTHAFAAHARAARKRASRQKGFKVPMSDVPITVYDPDEGLQSFAG
jgi:hypothetical protein